MFAALPARPLFSPAGVQPARPRGKPVQSEILDSPLSVAGGSGDPADWVPARAGAGGCGLG